MSFSSPDFLPNEALPSDDAIATMCREAGYSRTGIALRDSSQAIIAWIKYGPNVTRAEALTQAWVSKVIHDNPTDGVRVPRVHKAFVLDTPDCPIGHIVMEYVDAPDCDAGDVQLVAQAVQKLISLRGPTAAPGPVGGGPIVHSFFVRWESNVTYNTVEQLEEHINNILKYKQDKQRVHLVDDSSDGLRLCPCDFNPGNFKKLGNGQVVALDFKATCFMPPSFFAVAVRKAENNFAYQVAKHVNAPPSNDLSAMLAASGFLVPFMSNKVALPKSLAKK